MSRAAILDTLRADARLIALGFDATSIVLNYDSDQRPNDALFMVLQYGDDNYFPEVKRYVKNLTIWVHCYADFSTDFVRIDNVIDIVDSIMENAVYIDGADGHTLTLAEPTGRSRDLRDSIYETICRSTSYRILSRQTEPV